VEYAERNLAVYCLTDVVKTMVATSIIVALFFPYNPSSFTDLGSYE
jgi:formate hydrogenlyase subunit 4